MSVFRFTGGDSERSISTKIPSLLGNRLRLLKVTAFTKKYMVMIALKRNLQGVIISYRIMDNKKLVNKSKFRY